MSLHQLLYRSLNVLSPRQLKCILARSQEIEALHQPDTMEATSRQPTRCPHIRDARDRHSYYSVGQMDATIV